MKEFNSTRKIDRLFDRIGDMLYVLLLPLRKAWTKFIQFLSMVGDGVRKFFQSLKHSIASFFTTVARVFLLAANLLVLSVVKIYRFGKTLAQKFSQKFNLTWKGLGEMNVVSKIRSNPWRLAQYGLGVAFAYMIYRAVSGAETEVKDAVKKTFFFKWFSGSFGKTIFVGILLTLIIFLIIRFIKTKKTEHWFSDLSKGPRNWVNANKVKAIGTIIATAAALGLINWFLSNAEPFAELHAQFRNSPNFWPVNIAIMAAVLIKVLFSDTGKFVSNLTNALVGITIVYFIATQFGFGTSSYEDNSNVRSRVLYPAGMQRFEGNPRDFFKSGADRDSIIKLLSSSDDSMLVEIAMAESRGNQYTDSARSKVLHGVVDKDDIGVLQINQRIHKAVLDSLARTSDSTKYNIETLAGNVNFGKYLVEQKRKAGKTGFDLYGDWDSSSCVWKNHESGGCTKLPSEATPIMRTLAQRDAKASQDVEYLQVVVPPDGSLSATVMKDGGTLWWNSNPSKTHIVVVDGDERVTVQAGVNASINARRSVAFQSVDGESFTMYVCKSSVSRPPTNARCMM